MFRETTSHIVKFSFFTTSSLFTIFDNARSSFKKRQILILVVLALCFISKAETIFVIIIAFCSPSYLGQETAKRPFGPRVKLPPAHMSITHTHTVKVLHCLLNC